MLSSKENKLEWGIKEAELKCRGLLSHLLLLRIQFCSIFIKKSGIYKSTMKPSKIQSNAPQEAREEVVLANQDILQGACANAENYGV